MTFVLVLLVVAAILFVLANSVRLAQPDVTQSDDDTLGVLAARLGLAVTAGDPGMSLLAFRKPVGDYRRRIRLAGAPRGRPATFLIVDGQETDELLDTLRATRTYGCFLDVETCVALPTFEVTLRRPDPSVLPELQFADRRDLQQITTGAPDLDVRFLVRATDPHMGSALVPMLRALARLRYVHVAGEGSRVFMALSRAGLAHFGAAPEGHLLALETGARALEARARVMTSAAPGLARCA